MVATVTCDISPHPRGPRMRYCLSLLSPGAKAGEGWWWKEGSYLRRPQGSGSERREVPAPESGSGKRLRRKNTSVGRGNCCQAATPTPARSRGSGSRVALCAAPLRPPLFSAAALPASRRTGSGHRRKLRGGEGAAIILGEEIWLLRQKPGPGSGSAEAGEVSRDWKVEKEPRIAFGQRQWARWSGIAAGT